jgi:glycosyltransferase involved in cell wall biosynthesis
MPRISLVIPAFNEERYLPLLLDSIESARQQYAAGPDEVEVVVADNASTDGTARLARLRGCRVVRVEKRAIAAARNGGARVATGRILGFVDADSRIHLDTFNAIERTLASDRVVVGATGVRMSRMSPGIAFTLLLVTPVMRLAGYDTGVVFCRRDDWKSVGGYDEGRLWAEDVAFMRALKRLGRARGQRFVRAKGACAVTSARKFDQHGDWHCFRYALRGPAWLLLNRPAVDRFVRSYWYDDRQ